MGLADLSVDEWTAVCAAVDAMLDTPPSRHPAILDHAFPADQRLRTAAMQVYLQCLAEGN